MTTSSGSFFPFKKRKKKAEQKEKKGDDEDVFEIVGKKKIKINGAPPGHFPNELHEFTFNTGLEGKGGESQAHIQKKKWRGIKEREKKKQRKKKDQI